MSNYPDIIKFNISEVFEKHDIKIYNYGFIENKKYNDELDFEFDTHRYRILLEKLLEKYKITYLSIYWMNVEYNHKCIITTDFFKLSIFNIECILKIEICDILEKYINKYSINVIYLNIQKEYNSEIIKLINNCNDYINYIIIYHGEILTINLDNVYYSYAKGTHYWSNIYHYHKNYVEKLYYINDGGFEEIDRINKGDYVDILFKQSKNANLKI